MSKRTKIIIWSVVALILVGAIVTAAVFFSINNENETAFNVHKAIKEREAKDLALLVAKFDENERNIELEKVVSTEVEKIYKSENYEDILFCEEFLKELTTRAKHYEKGVRPFVKDLKKIPHEYPSAKNKAYMKGYWVRTDGEKYKDTVVIVAGNSEGSLTASIRTVGPNYEGYKEGDPLWSNITFGEGYRFNTGVLTRTKDVYFAYRPGSGALNIDKNTVTISVEGEIQNWKKADYEEIKNIKYGYDAYAKTSWISKDNSACTLTVTECRGDRISFEVYNADEDIKLVITNLALEKGEGDFDSNDETMMAGTIKINGAKITINFVDETYTSGDYILQ